MLREVTKVRQIPQEGHRRWFRSPDMDLFVWYKDQDLSDILGFQLCYQIGPEEKAITWRKEHGFQHNSVDTGEIPGSNKETPILVADGVFIPEKTLNNFLSQAGKMESALVEFIREKIREYP